MIDATRRRLPSPHSAAILGFTIAITAAEKHRRVLKRQFGYDDRQIAALAMIYQKRLTRGKKHG